MTNDKYSLSEAIRNSNRKSIYFMGCFWDNKSMVKNQVKTKEADTMYRNLQVEALRKQQALEYLATEIAPDTLCYSVNTSELDVLHLEGLVRTMKLSPDDISCVINDWLIDGTKQYIGAYYMRDERRMREFLDNPYNSVVFSLACDNIDTSQAISIWESISKRHLSESEKNEVAKLLTPRMEKCYNDICTRCR